GTEMAVADDPVWLPVGELKEPHGLAVGIVPEAGGAQHRILGGDRQRRVQPAHRPTYLFRLIFRAGEGVEAAVGRRLEQAGPALEALGAREDPRSVLLAGGSSSAR